MWQLSLYFTFWVGGTHIIKTYGMSRSNGFLHKKSLNMGQLLQNVEVVAMQIPQNCEKWAHFEKNLWNW